MSQSESEALEEQKRKNQAARDLIHSWMEDESSDDEDEWPLVEQFLEELSRKREPLPEQKEAA